MRFVGVRLSCHLFPGVKYLLRKQTPFLWNLSVKSLHKEVNPRIEDKLKRKDKIPEDYKIIYRAPYEIWVKAAYGVAIVSTTIFPSLFCSLLFYQGFNFPLMLGDYPVVRANWELAVYAGGLAIIIGQLSMVVFRYPFRIYRDKSCDNYLLLYQSLIPWRNKKEAIKSGELKPYTKAIFSWNDSLYEFRNKKAIIFVEHFSRPVEFEAMLGGKKIE